jgi:hypothetical protein
MRRLRAAQDKAPAVDGGGQMEPPAVVDGGEQPRRLAPTTTWVCNGELRPYTCPLLGINAERHDDDPFFDDNTEVTVQQFLHNPCKASMCAPTASAWRARPTARARRRP